MLPWHTLEKCILFSICTLYIPEVHGLENCQGRQSGGEVRAAIIADVIVAASRGMGRSSGEKRSTGQSSCGAADHNSDRTLFRSWSAGCHQQLPDEQARYG